MKPPTIIQLISGPRNLSTALMYAFAQRSDTRVIDEPFYGHYLRTTGLDHPGKELVLAAQPEGPEDTQEGFFKPQKEEVLFIKNMAHHLQAMDLNYLQRVNNLFLIRNPKQLIASFARVMPQPTAQDVGLPQAWNLFQYLTENTSRIPLVLDAADLLKDPKGILRMVCEAVNLPFDERMLRWPKGGIPEDGVWAPWWYANVHQSTGFAPQPTSELPLPSHCQEVYEEVLPYYTQLSLYAIKSE